MLYSTDFLLSAKDCHTSHDMKRFEIGFFLVVLCCVALMLHSTVNALCMVAN